MLGRSPGGSSSGNLLSCRSWKSLSLRGRVATFSYRSARNVRRSRPVSGREPSVNGIPAASATSRIARATRPGPFVATAAESSLSPSCLTQAVSRLLSSSHCSWCGLRAAGTSTSSSDTYPAGSLLAPSPPILGRFDGRAPPDESPEPSDPSRSRTVRANRRLWGNLGAGRPRDCLSSDLSGTSLMLYSSDASSSDSRGLYSSDESSSDSRGP